MKRTIAAIALALLPAGALADMIFEYGGHTYKLIESPATWHEANAVAQRMSLGGKPGYLARIDSAAENDAVLNAVLGRLSEEQLKSSVPGDDSGAAFIWLGGTDQESEGQWVWSNNGDQFWSGDFNGSPVAGRYNNWGVQPDNVFGSEDSLAMGLADWPDPFYDLGASGQWNDLNSENNLFFVIEFESALQPIQMNLEEPLASSIKSGVGMIRGWAVADEPIARIEVFLNEKYMFDIPHGDLRMDVASRFPEVENSQFSGFSVPFRYSGLAEGSHEIKVVVVDAFGNRRDRFSKFDVTRFEKSYIGASDSPRMTWSYASAYGDTITVSSVEVGGKAYTVKLQWQPQSQKFEMVEITPN